LRFDRLTRGDYGHEVKRRLLRHRHAGSNLERVMDEIVRAARSRLASVHQPQELLNSRLPSPRRVAVDARLGSDNGSTYLWVCAYARKGWVEWKHTPMVSKLAAIGVHLIA
jgi:hypothetical protein